MKVSKKVVIFMFAVGLKLHIFGGMVGQFCRKNGDCLDIQAGGVTGGFCSNNKCVECRQDGDCQYKTGGRNVCDRGTCVRCIKDKTGKIIKHSNPLSAAITYDPMESGSCKNCSMKAGDMTCTCSSTQFLGGADRNFTVTNAVGCFCDNNDFLFLPSYGINCIKK